MALGAALISGAERGSAPAVGGRRASEPVFAGSRGAAQPARPPSARAVAVGALLITLAVTGLLHLAGGSPPVGGPAHAITGAGGYLGAALAAPLQAVVAGWGAGVILVALGLAGVLVATGTSVGRGAHHLVSAGQLDGPGRAPGRPAGRGLDGEFRRSPRVAGARARGRRIVAGGRGPGRVVRRPRAGRGRR